MKWLDRLYYVLVAFIVLLCIVLFAHFVHVVKSKMTETRRVEHICVEVDAVPDDATADLSTVDVLCEGEAEKVAHTLSNALSFIVLPDKNRVYACYRVDIAIFMAKNGQLPLEGRIVCEIQRP